ncbi:DUF1902 domain-containing protein [Mesorhizobium sp. B3-1-6]|uniref:DUF1902 domain-containing protein n=1 Tax=Mesorhizobium sp. B3-1-6 TaxID=2589895 RepID=UPI001126F61D|nr:DUF1902 domain-containing protein [Mesorhizobium sp. B3-1-6]TPI29002.1 DUF1902 domain-containing protein [Mesorhizobium sp. B3-1-6]
MRERTINIDVISHEKSGLLVAVSDELPGLYVHGDTYEEIRARLPDAIKSLVEASEKTQVEVQEVDDSDIERVGFQSQRKRFIYSAAA